MKYIKKLLKTAPPDWKKPKISYSQCGEDLLIDFMFQQLGMNKITYLDIGANDPVFLSNTYFFYKKGSTGVCIEPNPALCKTFKKKRPKDICLNMGVGITDEASADYYVMNADTLSTFSKESVEEFVRANYKLEGVMKIPLVSVNRIIDQNFQSAPHLITLDTEGLDFPILQTFDFAKFRPTVFCIETMTHVDEHKIEPIFELMHQHDYLIYADTYVNTIFVEKEIWSRRK